MPKKNKCPQCKTEIEYRLDNEFRPFCSERCKLIDLGDWADEKFKVPTNDSLSEQDIESTLNPIDPERKGSQLH